MAFAYHSQPRPGHCEGKKQSTVRERTELFGWAMTFDLAETKGPSATLEKTSVMGFGGFFSLYTYCNLCPLLAKLVQLPDLERQRCVFQMWALVSLLAFSFSSVPPLVPLHVRFFRKNIFPPKSSPAPPFSETELARVSAVRGALSVGYTLLAAFCSSERLAADTVQGCFFPSRVARGLFPSKLEPCSDAGSHTGRDQAAFSTLFTDFSIREQSATQLSPHSIAFCHTNRPRSDLPFCVEQKDINNKRKDVKTPLPF